MPSRPHLVWDNLFRKETEIVNVGELAKLGDGATVDAASLASNGLIRGSGAPVKLLAEARPLFFLKPVAAYLLVKRCYDPLGR